MKPLTRDHIIRIWLALAAMATIILGTAYTLVQQSTRLSVDDAPLAVGQTVKQQLESGASPTDVVPASVVDLKSDSSVFIIVTDSQEHILASSARLDGNTSLPPKGTFDFAAQKGSDHFTWQPAAGARLATRILPYKSPSQTGYVVTGQSLSQAESRINIYGWMTLAAWLAILIISYLVLWFPFPAVF